MLETYPDNNEGSPRIDNFPTNKKHNTSVGATKLEKDGPRIFNVAEYFKNKGAGQIDFTEVSSDFRNMNKKSSFNNSRDPKEDK